MPVVRAGIPLLRRKDNSLAFDAVVVGAADRSIPQDPVREDTNMDAARANVKLMQAWLDAHNCQDMKALDYTSETMSKSWKSRPGSFGAAAGTWTTSPGWPIPVRVTRG